MPRIKTSNCISRLLWFGSDFVGIQKMRSTFFEKKQRQRRCSYAAPPAVEANVLNLKELAATVGLLNNRLCKRQLIANY
jgi:hypothetical protein